MDQKIAIKCLREKDLPQIARVHIDSFPDGALTKLGPEVVQQYYLWQLSGPHKKVRAVGAFVEDECAGFSFSGIFDGSTSGFVRQNRALLAKAALLRPGLFFNSLFLDRVSQGLKVLFKPKRKRRAGVRQKSPAVPSYGILSIAVSPGFQKMGVGRLLMQDAEEEALKCGQRKLCLTVHPENEKAVRFYEGLHWQKLVIDGPWSGTMTKSLD